MQESNPICKVCSLEVSKTKNSMILNCQHTFHVSCFLKSGMSKCLHCQQTIQMETILRTPSPRRRSQRPPSIYEERQQRQTEIREQSTNLQRQLYMELRISEN